MKSRRRNEQLLLLGAVALAAFPACRGAAICEPPWSTAGQFVRVRNSEAYLREMEQTGGDVPHVACRAESTISTQQLYLRESEPTTYNVAPGIVAKNYTQYDSRVMTPRGDIGRFGGDYRVMGVGRGVDAADCSRAAISACDDAIDGYWRKQRAVPPPRVSCRLLADNEQCPASGSYEPVALAASEPKVAPRSEPPLVGLIKKLDDKRTRRDAVRGLVQFFENAKARAHGDVSDPTVRALVDKIVEPLANTYSDLDLDDATRADLIRVLGEASDVRAGRAWVRALTSFGSGKATFEDDVSWAAHGLAATLYQEGAPALGEAFARLEAGSLQGAHAGKKVRDAMVALRSPGWKAMLIEKVGRPIESASSNSTGYKNELYWQTTAAETLGELRDASATKALVKVMMDSHKKAIETTALVALVAIGKDAIPVLSDVLLGKDTELAELGKARASENDGDPRSFVRVAAKALGAMGRPEARDPLIRALKSPDSPANHAAITRALTGLPPSAETAKAFLLGYDKVTPAYLRAELLDAATDLHDAERVPWMLSQAKAMQAAYVRQVALRSAIEVMKPAQVAAVKAAVEKLGSEAEKGAFEASAQLLNRCGDDVGCYVDKAVESDGDAKGAPVEKAAAMVAMLGDREAAMKLIGRLSDMRSSAARRAALGAIDHLIKSDGAAAADALMKTIDDGADESRTATKLVALRLRAR